MATVTWKLSAGTDSWSNTSDWSAAALPGPSDRVYIGSKFDTGNVVVNEDITFVEIYSLTMAAKPGNGKNSNTTTLALTSGATLTVDGTISLGTNTIIDGTGTLTANGAISGGGAIIASSGTLSLSGTGSIASGGAVLSIGTTVQSTLELNLSGGITTGAISVNNANQILEIGPNGSVTITAAENISNGTLQMAGGTLTDGSGIILGPSRATGTLTGFGTVNANLSPSGSGTPEILATGGTLDLSGTVASGLVLAINVSAPADLKIDGSATASTAIAITSANQKLEIGAAGSLTIQGAESITNGTIQLDGGTLIDASGIVIDSGATLTGKGTVSGAVSGSGVVKASGGVLDLTSNVTSTGTTFQIDVAQGTVLELAGTAAGTFTFLGSVGMLELSDIANGVVQGFNGTIAGLNVGTSATIPTNAVNIQAPVTSATLSGSQITVMNGTMTVATLQLSVAPNSGRAAVTADNVLGGYDVFLTSAAPGGPTVTWSPSAETGVEGHAISLGTIMPSGGSGSYSSVLVSGVPVGATLGDGAHSFTASTGNTSFNIVGWNYGSLSITPPNDNNFSLSVQVTDSLGNTSTPAAESVTVDPLVPTVAPVAVSGSTGQAIPLNLGISVANLSGDANSLSSVTISNIPSGATLSNSNGPLTISNGSITLSANQIAGLALTSTNTGTFNLGVSATERDAQNDPSATATGTESVKVAGTMTTGVPAFDHIVLVVEENQDYNQIIGNSQAPYINNTLAAGGASLSNYFGITHPSEPNYLALYSGSTWGVIDNGTYSFQDPTLYTQLKSGGKTFTGYYETPQEQASSPWLSFPEGASVESNFSNFPTSNFSSLPTVSFVIPNLDDSGHNTTISTMDSWLQQHLNSYAQWAMSNNSLLIVTWDEDSGTPTNQVAALLYGAHVNHGSYATQYNHYNMLSTLLAGYNLTGPNNAATAAPIQVFSNPTG